MQYLLLIYQRESDWAGLSEAETGKIFEEYIEFSKGIRKSGHSVGGNALQPVATATTVRVRNGKTLTTDGPFAETKEQLGGYYLIEAKDLDDAIAIAARIPDARSGSIEVRPIMPTPPVTWQSSVSATSKSTARPTRSPGPAPPSSSRPRSTTCCWRSYAAGAPSGRGWT